MWCTFCAKDVSSKNFVRHLERSHNNENKVKSILDLPTKSKERRLAFELLRRNTNFDLYINGTIRPLRETTNPDISAYYPCIYCKATIKKSYLQRHSKACKSRGLGTANTILEKNRSYLTGSQTLAACSIDPTNIISRLNVKEQVCTIDKKFVFSRFLIEIQIKISK